jgi:pyruvate dehydrogenase E2 component (dihydrolipoamide acetyltransferase)
MALVEIQVPDIGDFDEVAVIELLVKPGDTVKPEQSLITVESDKASMEIPSSSGGVVHEVLVKLGDKIKQGDLIARLESQDATAPAPAAKPVAAPAAQAAATASAAAAAAPAAATSNASAGPTQILVPDIGDFKDVTVIEVLVKVGDTVKVEQSLVTVESDKASMEIPSSVAGEIAELAVKLGDKINIGDLLAVVKGSGIAKAAAAPVAASTATAAASAPVAPPAAPAAVAPSAVPAAAPHNPSAAVQTGMPHASPSVRKFAREIGVPLAEVKGSGPKGRITLDDVQAFTRAVMAGASQTKASAATRGDSGPTGGGSELGLIAWPKVDFTKFGPIERKDMSRIKKISAANLHRNWVMIPHVTNHDDADITDLEAFRVSTNKENEKSGIKVTMLAFLIKACVAALRKFPEFNASIDGDQLVLKQYYHIGFAADTPNGLMVPVIKDADKKGVMQISQEMGELAKKARDGKLSPAEMSGAGFTISSLGGIGGRYFTPIINAPEVSILGVCRSTTEPVWNGSAFVPRLMLPLSLSWDHRVIDGAAAARFNVYLGQILGDFRRVLL